MTQDECRQKWDALKAQTIAAIAEIDRETPGSPTSDREPKWWLEMIDIRKALLSTNQHSPKHFCG